MTRYLQNESITDLGRYYNVTSTSIIGILQRRNIPLRGKRKHFFNENAFENIDNEEKAYWLGFLCADGNVFSNTLSIALATVDKDHLLKFAQFLNYPNPELDHKEKPDSWRIRCNSKKMVQNVIKAGCPYNKTHTLTTPTLPKELYCHFYRGVFDGDGWFSKRKNRFNIVSLGLSGASLPFIQDFHRWAKEHSGKDIGSLINIRNTFWQVTFEGTASVMQVANILYFNAKVFLERKHNFYESIRA